MKFGAILHLENLESLRKNFESLKDEEQKQEISTKMDLYRKKLVKDGLFQSTEEIIGFENSENINFK